MHWFRLLLLIPLFLAVWTPLSDRINPTLLGIPFLLWFQFLIVLIGMAVTGTVFVIYNRLPAEREQRGSSR